MSSTTGSLSFDTSRRNKALETVGAHAASGAFWTVLLSALNKCLAMGSQLVLAYILLPADFGLVAMALSVTSLIAITNGTTLKSVLMQRMDRFEQYAPHAFWLALALNLGGALLLAILALIAGMVFKESRVVPLVLIFALAVPFQALPTIYAAALARQLRFREIAIINLGAGIIQNTSSVILAWLGFGAYSLIIPLVIMAFYMAIAYRFTAGKIQVGLPQVRQWGELRRSVSWLMVITGLAALQASGASLVISLIHDSKVTGYFYWGFIVSNQLVFLLATNLQQVMLAVLAKLNSDNDRQSAAATKAIQTLTILLAPVCLLQVVLAGPLIGFVFNDRWQPAVPVVEFISIALVTQPLNMLSASLLTARGKFRRLAGTTAVMTALLLISAAIGSVLGEQREAAMFVMGGIVIGNLYAGWLVFKEYGKGWPELFAALLPAMLLTIPLAVVTWGAWHNSTSLIIPIRAAITVVACASTYVLLLKGFYPRVLNEIIARFRRRGRMRERSSMQA